MDHGVTGVVTAVVGARNPFLRGFRWVSGPLAVFGAVLAVANKSGSGGVGSNSVLAALISSAIVVTMWVIDRVVNRRSKVNDLAVRQLELIEKSWEAQRTNWADDLDRANAAILSLREQLSAAENEIQHLTDALARAREELAQHST